MKQNEIEERFKFASYIDRKSTETDFLKSKMMKKYISITETQIYYQDLILIYYFTDGLADQYSEKLQAKEKKLQSTMKERQELFNMAFQQDMQLYKESGIVPKIPSTRGKSPNSFFNKLKKIPSLIIESFYYYLQ